MGLQKLFQVNDNSIGNMIRVWVILVIGALQFARSDIYMHNPRGSNNRWNENTRNRNNANRMFDSQNNDRGGYNVGSLYYYVGSNLQIEWTNQHSCGDQNNHCDVVLQYMCGNQVRDGTSTSTIPSNPVQCKALDCNEDRQYGMHEDFFYYTHCKLRSRNLGLFIADQNVGPSATQTRQNRGGTRFGYECAEERDYYPYWGPTPWKDIAVLTNDLSRCHYYVNESQNTKEKYACKIGTTFLYQNSQKNPNPRIPIEKEECEAFSYTESGVEKRGVWQRYDAHGIAPPECVSAQPSRDNHLGNGLGGQHLNYNWTIPNDVNSHCTLRIRYNISTSDYDRDNTDSKYNNRLVGRQKREDKPGVDLWTRQGLTEEEGIERGYILENNPKVDIFKNDKMKLQLAVNTAQYGRTFEDRSHTFAIRPRPVDVPSSAKIQNINVRGKRGNIVQVYPAVEYDFVPNTVIATSNDYVHYQWTGSDNNPNNNDGQGRAGTDRSNAVLLADASYVEGRPELRPNTFGQLGRSYPNYLSQATFAGFDMASRIAIAILKPHIGGDMAELNSAGTYFDFNLRKVTMPGVYNYMCTRNNNFSNRSQKGRLLVTNSAFSQQTVDQNGAFVSVQNGDQVVAAVAIAPQALTSPTSIEIWQLSTEDAVFSVPPPNTDYISSAILLSPTEVVTKPGYPMTLQFQLTSDLGALHEITIYRSSGNTTSWEKVSLLKREGRNAFLHTNKGGYFIASKQLSAGPVAGLVIGLVVGFVLIVVGGVMCVKNRGILKGYGNNV